MWGILGGEALHIDAPRQVEIKAFEHSLFATGEGVFDRSAMAGQSVKTGDVAGRFHYLSEPERASETITFPRDGMVLAHTNRGYVQRGDMLMLVVQDHI